MLIESKIRREKGTSVTLDRETYNFQPRQGTAAHICEVANQHHIARFLAIPEGFRPFDTGLLATASAPYAASPASVASVDTDDDDFGDFVDPANQGFTDGPVAPPAPPAPEAASAAKPDAPAHVAEENPVQTADDTDANATALSPAEQVEAMTDEEAFAAYAVKNGRAAPGNTLPETVRGRLVEMLEAEQAKTDD